MILYGSTMSPFVRLVRVVAREVRAMEGLVEVIADPWGDEAFRRINPLGKIPALVTDEGDVLFDSPVICEFLDASFAGSRLVPREGRERWQTLTVRACAIGLMDAAYLRRNEAIRPQAATISRAFVDRQDAAIRAALDSLETDIGRLAAPVNIASLAVGTALGYLDFRFPGCDWRSRCPGLDSWWETLRARRSFVETRHVDPSDVAPPAMAFPLRVIGEG
jgi:glutathione S-transferase